MLAAQSQQSQGEYAEPSAAFAADGQGTYYYDGYDLGRREELTVQQAPARPRAQAGRGRRRGGGAPALDERAYAPEYALAPVGGPRRDFQPVRYAAEPIRPRLVDPLSDVLRACDSIRGIGRRVIDTLKDVISSGYNKPGSNVNLDANFDLTAQMVVSYVERFGPENVAFQLGEVYTSLERTPGFKKGLFNFVRGTLRNLLEGVRK